jgi:5-methylthioadenosine/S-adenosylhomocysteine deaminase
VTFILADACAVTVNSANDIIERGSILVVDDRIAAIGSLVQVNSEAPGADSIDCAGNILIPGMVNTHRHLFQTLLRDLATTWC